MAACTIRTRFVLSTLANTASMSRGTKVRMSMTSTLIPSPSSSSAAASASCTCQPQVTTVTSSPDRLTSATPSGMTTRPGRTGPRVKSRGSDSMKMHGSSSKMHE